MRRLRLWAIRIGVRLAWWWVAVRGRLRLPGFGPGVEHIEQQVQGTGRDWKASPAVTPMEWSADIRGHNAAMDRVARIERLELWADLLQRGDRQLIADRAGYDALLHELIWGEREYGVPETGGSTDEDRRLVARCASLYFAAEQQQLFSRRTNVTGLETIERKLTPEEIAAAREDARLQAELASKRRALAHPDEPVSILHHLGTDAEILAACGGDEALAAQVKARALALAPEADWA